MPKSKHLKRLEALERMEKGPSKAVVKRVKKFPRSQEQKQAEMDRLKKLVRREYHA